MGKLRNGRKSRDTGRQTCIPDYFVALDGKSKKESVVVDKVSANRPTTSSSTDSSSRSISKVEQHVNSSSALKTPPSMLESSSSKFICPSYKRVKDTPYVVDAFSYGYIPGITAYFLSHFHSDHYNGLKKSFSKRIYCSKVTANLIKLKFKVSDYFIRVLSLNQWVGLTDGTQVMAIDANHCPGSVLFLFELPSGQTYLHTGDLRAESCVISSPHLQNLRRLDIMYLDTTYLDIRYKFPPQAKVIKDTVDFIFEETTKNPHSLIVCGTYTIGKEKMFRALSDALHCKIGVTRSKMDVLRCLEDSNMQIKLTTDLDSTPLHVVFGELNQEQLIERLSCYPKYSHIISVWPSGWEYSSRSSSSLKVKRSGIVTRIGVAYSEHSSYDELKSFVQTLKPRQIVPTVNFGQREKMQAIFSSWISEYNSQQKMNTFLNTN